MSERQKGQSPYKLLGNNLRRLREKLQESLAEVAGAVEIDVALLTEIEQGTKRPSEDILLLMVSHFAVRDDEATRLWELAGYTQHQNPAVNAVVELENLAKQPIVMLPLEARIVYSDMVHVMVNNYGVVMNFMQGAGANNQPVAIARVGMSKEHAQSVMELLQKTLAQAGPQALPAPDTSSDKKLNQ